MSRVVEFEHGYILDDHYKIISLIAVGGMSTIYKAARIDNRQIVAIKVPHQETDDKQSSVQRFKHGCQISLKLNHPKILRFFPIKHQQSRLYAVMEYMEGRTVRETLQKVGRFPPEKAIDITMQVCEALSFIHKKRIVHQDIKPDNIFILTNGNIKLIDFGLSYCPDMPEIPWRDLLGVGGTPEYLAPERVNGINDIRSDIYNLGITLYEMMTGKTPFYRLSVKDIINAHLKFDPPSPRDRAPYADISRKLEKAILKALKKSPGERYQNAEEFKNYLQLCLRRNPFENIDWMFIIIGLLVGILIILIFLLARAVYTLFV